MLLRNFFVKKREWAFLTQKKYLFWFYFNGKKVDQAKKIYQTAEHSF